jgi:NADH dehydrogenase [ubiquinone] 1 alpha subcomplex assembly factor 7
MERLDAFMARANAAYYAERDPYADFTTSPEITQVFGEVLGLWAAVTWEAMGRPDPVLLVECGPGRGTLMADALRATGGVAAPFRAALRVHLVETSPRLRAQQAARVPDAAWHDALANLPPGPLILLANEFLDALPIRQFVRRGAGWAERFVDGGAFVEQLAAPPDLDAARAEEGAVVELCEPARATAGHVARRVVRDGGAALFLDYGPAESAPGDSLQALQDGRPASPLGEPGTADLTAHVDFAALARVAQSAGAAVHGPVPQGVFLTRLGLFQRTGRLAQTQPPGRAAALVQAAQRLAEPDRMGRLFKAMAVCHPALPCPAGFEP